MLHQQLEALKKNYKPVIASLLLAFILWFAVTTNKEYTTKISIPFSISRLAKDKILAELPPEEVILEVRGKGRSLVSLNFLDKNFVLELPDVKNSTTIQLQDYISYINIPSDLGIEIVDILEPKRINLNVDDFLRAQKPIKIQRSIKPSPGYIIVDVTSSTDSAWVSGPASMVRAIDFIKTDSLLYEDVKYPFQVSTDLNVPRPDILQLEPNKINVSFNLEQLVERSIYNIPIQIVRVPDNLKATAEPSTIMIRVKGGESLVSDLKPGDISVVFDYSKDYRQDITEYPMQIETPLGVSWQEASPQKFKLNLAKKE